ncbi:hypothetical protein [Bradyrhizobium sp. HKCCYLR1023]|uniref:hypothetical protein n=1 Tax=Bradyrhizobium TaxID=374 RepID=UPI003EBB42EA
MRLTSIAFWCFVALTSAASSATCFGQDDPQSAYMGLDVSGRFAISSPLLPIRIERCRPLAKGSAHCEHENSSEFRIQLGGLVRVARSPTKGRFLSIGVTDYCDLSQREFDRTISDDSENSDSGLKFSTKRLSEFLRTVMDIPAKEDVFDGVSAEIRIFDPRSADLDADQKEKAAELASTRCPSWPKAELIASVVSAHIRIDVAADNRRSGLISALRGVGFVAENNSSYVISRRRYIIAVELLPL